MTRSLAQRAATTLTDARFGLLLDLLQTQHPGKPWDQILITFAHGAGNPHQPEIGLLQHRLGLRPGHKALWDWIFRPAKPNLLEEK